MTIRVTRFAAAEALPIRSTFEAPDGTTVRQLIDLLDAHYGSDLRGELLDGDVMSHGTLIMLNGESLYQLKTELDTPIKDGDEVFFTVMVCGG